MQDSTASPSASLSMATDQVLYSLIASAGGKDVINAENEVTFDNEGTVAALELYQELLNYAPSDCDTYTWGEPQGPPESGKGCHGDRERTVSGDIRIRIRNECGKSAVRADPGAERFLYIDKYLYSNGFMLLSDDEEKREAAKTFLTLC